MKFFETRYRVIRDTYNGYEAQFKHWWMPFYLQIGGTNTFTTEIAAKNLCMIHAAKPVWQSTSSNLDKS